MSNNGDNIHISGVQGDVIGAKVSGTGSIVGKDIVISGTINVGVLGLEKIPSEYSKALKDFSKKLMNNLYQIKFLNKKLNQSKMKLRKL